MTDDRHEPHGPERLPDEQPVPNPNDVTAQPALRYGSTSRWLVPAGVLAVVAIVLYCFAFQLQVILPVIGILFVAVIWVVMLIVSRRGGARADTNRRLAWFMGAMAVGALLVAIAIYVVESTRLPWT